MMRPLALVSLLSVLTLNFHRATAEMQETTQLRLRATARDHLSATHGLAFSADGKMLASGSQDQSVKLWDVATNKVIATLPGHPGSVWAVAISPDGKMLAAGSGHLNAQGTRYLDGEIQLWDIAQRRTTATLGGHKESINSLAFTLDGKLILSAAGDAVKLWDVAGDRATFRRNVSDSGASCAIFTSDGKSIYWGGDDAEIHCQEVSSGRLAGSLTGHRPFIRSLSFSPDGKTLVSCSDDCIKLWEVRTGTERATLSGHKSVVFAAAIGQDGKMMVSGSNDGVIKLWDLSSSKDTTLLDDLNIAVYTLKFSPDGKTLAGARSDGSVLFWDVATPKNGKE